MECRVVRQLGTSAYIFRGGKLEKTAALLAHNVSGRGAPSHLAKHLKDLWGPGKN